VQALHDVRQKAASQAQAIPTTTADVKTIAPPAGAVACMVTVETNSARLSFNGVDPASSNGMVFPKDVAPVYLPFAVTIKAVSTAAGNAVTNVTWLY
jgi:hypothetical protein